MMNTKMYVGNLSFQATEADLRDLFGEFGEISEVAQDGYGSDTAAATPR